MNIQPFQIWQNGSMQTVTQMLLQLVWDNLSDQATFYYRMQTAIDETVTDGNLNMSGSDYTNWNANPDINLAAYEWAAQQLNVILL